MALNFTKQFDTPGKKSLFSPVSSLNAVFGLDGNDTFFSYASSKTYNNGQYWLLPSLLSGGTGDDSYNVGPNDAAIIADAGSGTDQLRIYGYLSDVQWFARVDNRHLLTLIQGYNPIWLLVVDAFRPQGSIEKIEFSNSVIFDSSWNNLPSLIASSGIPFEDLGWDQAINKKYIDLSVVGASNNNAGANQLLDDLYKAGNPVTGSGVYRFFNPVKGVHLYSNDLNEVNTIRSQLGNYQFEGKVYDPVTGLGATQLNRFFNPKASYHFMTTNDAEAQSIIGHPEWGFNYEGKSYSVSTTKTVAAATPVNRFYRVIDGVGQHFYTSSESEKLNVIANPSWGYQYEGIAWYAI